MSDRRGAAASSCLRRAFRWTRPALLAGMALAPCAAGAASPGDTVGRASLALQRWAPRILEAGATLERSIEGTAPAGTRPTLLQLVAWLEIACGAPEEAATAWSRVQAEAERRGDERAAQSARQQQAEFAVILGRYAEVQTHAQRLLDYARASNDSGFRASALDYAAVLARRRGELDSASKLQRQALELRRERSDPAAIRRSLTNLGVVRRDQGDFAGALALYLEAMRLGANRDDAIEAGVYRSIALLYREVDDPE
ncbi:MAG TPA: tetratricopeptide repeat protein, partial [Mizugakiibacter sp.]